MTRPYRVVLAGCGGISRAWLEPLKASPELELVGLVDLLVEVARARAAEFGFTVPLGTDLAEMLEVTQPDLVFDCTVPEAHHGVTLTALEYGAHVFGEKPMADSYSQAKAMVQAAQTSGRVYAVMQNRRYDPTIRTLRDFLRSGAIGQLSEVHSDFFIAAHFGGFREKMQHVLIKDMAIHTFDAARFLIGADPLTVYCREWNPAGSWYSFDASALALFEMRGGAMFSYRGSWCSEGLHTPWESTWRIVGTKGSVIWDENGLRCDLAGEGEGLIREPRSLTLPEPKAPHPLSWHAAAIEAFVSALREGKAPETVCEDNLYSLQMVLGATESSERGVTVDLDEMGLVP